MSKKSWGLPLAFVALSLLVGTAASSAADKTAALAPKYKQFLADVSLLITKPERAAFLALDKDYQRDGFIHRFWEARNPFPGSSRNTFKLRWESRLEQARTEYGGLSDDRAQMLMLHGPPQEVLKEECHMLFWPLEFWRYTAGENVQRGLYVLFFQRGAGGAYRRWRPSDGYQELQAIYNVEPVNLYTFDKLVRTVNLYCPGGADRVLRLIVEVQTADQAHLYDVVDAPPPPRDTEWINTFKSLSTELPDGAGKLAARVEVGYPSRDRAGRTLVSGLVKVPASEASPAELGGRRAYNFILTGEVLRDADLFESFRYRFDLPAAGLAGDVLPLVFERSLWPGEYTLILRVEDLHSHHSFRDERPLAVPDLGEGSPAAATAAGAGPGFGGVVDAARASLQQEAATLKIVPPGGELQSGPLRLEAQATGEAVRKVTFFLDGKEMLSRARPPYSVELNLGDLPRTREVRAVAYDAGGQVVASDTLQLNAPRQRFAVRLLEPRAGGSYQDRVPVRAEVRVPDGASLERLEIFLGEDRVATLYQPPYTLAVPLPAHAAAGFVRAVAFLGDGTAAEDLAVINAPDVAERMEVRLVELYTAVLDAAGRPVRQLKQEDFKVIEQGKEQTILRFEPVRDLPLHLLFAVDTSASMAGSIAQVQKAAVSFLDRTVKGKDQAALVTFSDSPILRMPFTNDVGGLAGALAGLNAERGTALWDSLVYALSYMKGATGQSALLLFTDGDDRLSHLRFEEALEFARRSGVAIYPVGMQVPRLDRQVRSHLAKLAAETGGRCFFIDSAVELDGVDAAIEEELRARYLLAYQPQNPPRQGEFRAVEVRVAGEGRQAKTIHGYYP